MTKTKLTTALSALSFLLFSLLCKGQVIQEVIQPSDKDAHIISSSTSQNYNDPTISCFVNSNGRTTYIRRAFVDFNLDSIPTNAIITSAFIKLYRTSYNTNPNLEISRVIENWEETGVNWSNQPNVSLSDEIVSTPSVEDGFHVFEITNQVQEYVNYPNLNYGWRIKSNNESPQSYTCYDKYGNKKTCYENFGSSYGSRTYGTTSRRPILEINYVLPIEIELVEVNHTTSINHSDGSIEINATKGAGGYSYEWFDGNIGGVLEGQTEKQLTGVSKGWYGVTVIDMDGNRTYMAFLIGVYCESTVIEFDPGPKFIDDAYVYNLVRNGIDYGDTYNGGHSTVISTMNWTYSNWYLAKNFLKFNLHLDQSYVINSADVTVFGRDHWNYTGTNESKFKRLTQDWGEYQVTWNTSPTSTSTDEVLLNATTSNTQNDVMNWIDFFNYWQNNPSSNYGTVLELQNPTPNSFRRRRYFSSDDPDDPKPKLDIEIMVPCPIVYAKLEKTLSGVQYDERNGNIYFIVKEEYYDEDGELNYAIYNTNKQVVISSTGTTKQNHYGDNRREIDVSSLNNDSWYILEVTNDKNEVFKLRFKTN